MNKEFETVVGLEIHAELKTASKLFCSCSTAFGGEPNTHVCAVCAGFPGALPVMNRAVVELSIRAGLAMHAEIAKVCKFDRKNYFYPDLPTAYQISQFYQPVCSHGYLEILVDGNKKRIGITRAHIEEDAGKLVHQGDITVTPFSLVDLNRSGVPLLEIVSEPDMRSSAEARAYAEKLRSILLFAEVSDCKMEEGSLRFDANISVRPRGQQQLGTRVEIKNLNSFNALEKAIEYEAQRQIIAIEDGEELVQETRTWDEHQGITKSMRSKEEATDYRYFPDPDLPEIRISSTWIKEVRAAMPELQEMAQKRLVEEFNLPEYDAGILTESPDILKFFYDAVAHYDDSKQVANWIMGEITRLLKANSIDIAASKISPDKLTDLLKSIDSGQISRNMGKEVFAIMFASGQSAAEIIEQRGLAQISDTSALNSLIEAAVADNPKAVQDFYNGKQKALGALVGHIMKATKGQANPAVVNDLLIKKLQS